MLFMLSMFKRKAPYVVKPYLVGTKNWKSLAMIIPAKFAKNNQIDTSTIFILKNEGHTAGKITLQRIRYSEDAGENLEASAGRFHQEVRRQ